MALYCHLKNQIKRSSHSRDNLCEKIKKSNQLREFNNETIKVLEMTESICCFHNCLTT